MEVFRSVRIHLPDRPGALSSISTSLAVHDVNIERLHVVSHDGPVVIDDLDLSAASATDIDRAIAGFYPDVRVECFDSNFGDPILAVANGLAAIATAPTIEAARTALAFWVLKVVRGDAAALLSVTETEIAPIAGASLGTLGPQETAALRGAVVSGEPVSMTMGEGASALPFEGMQAVRAAIVRVSPASGLAVARAIPVPFASGEMDRLAAFAESAGHILALK